MMRMFWSCALTLTLMAGCASEPSGAEGCPTPKVPVGATPDFATDASLYVGMDRVKEAMDQGLKFIFVDARPGSDFLLGHIPGAVSLPFFDAESCAASLPRDVLYVTYCACPHAESGIVAKAIIDSGGKAKVLDEGFIAWKQAGYPVQQP